MQTREVTLEHPAGRVRVEVPADVRLEELIADLLDVAAQPDRDDWALGAAGGPPYPPHLTLAELGVTRGQRARLAHRQRQRHPGALPATPPPAPEDTDASAPAPVELNARASSPPASSRPAAEHDEKRRCGRSARAPHARSPTACRPLGAWRPRARARTRTPLRAREQRSRPTGVPDPALFALPARVSPLTRMRQAWALATTSGCSSS